MEHFDVHQIGAQRRGLDGIVHVLNALNNIVVSIVHLTGISNELLPNKLRRCSFTYCVDRDQLILQYYGSNDGSSRVVECATTLQSHTNNNTDLVNNIKQLDASTISTCATVTTNMIIPPRYSCSLHCRECRLTD
jgi:hypothetical protein